MADCHRVLDGIGGWACGEHGDPWPCRVPEDPDGQMRVPLDDVLRETVEEGRLDA